MKKAILLTIALLTALVSFSSCDNSVKVQDTFFGAKLGITLGEAKKTIKDNTGYTYSTRYGVCTFYDVEFGETKWNDTYINQSHGKFVSIEFKGWSYSTNDDFNRLKKELGKKYPLKKTSEGKYRYTDSKGLAVQLSLDGYNNLILEYGNADVLDGKRKPDYSEL